MFAALSSEAIHHLTDEWWAVQLDPIFTVDTGSCTLLSIQYNLVAGTLCKYLDQRPDLRPLLDKVLKFDVLYVPSPIDIAARTHNLLTAATSVSPKLNMAWTPETWRLLQYNFRVENLTFTHLTTGQQSTNISLHRHRAILHIN